MSARRVTSADVAAEAGVSRATVSYVLNGADERISASTRARVVDAADRLGYVPHAAAAALRAGRTSIVLFALPSWPLGEVVADFVSVCVAELERLGYTPLVHFGWGTDGGGLRRACDRVRPVGLVAPGADLPPARVDALAANGTRAIVAIAEEALGHVATLVADQSLVGELAVAHLAARGRRRIAVLLPPEPDLAELADGRLRGAERAARAAGAELTVLRVACECAEIGAALGGTVATGVFAFNDAYAVAALDGLAGAALRVPGDVAVIGCDDSAEARRAGLTTIALGGGPETWPTLVRRLDALVGGAEDRSPILAPPRLVPGLTT